MGIISHQRAHYLYAKPELALSCNILLFNYLSPSSRCASPCDLPVISRRRANENSVHLATYTCSSTPCPPALTTLPVTPLFLSAQSATCTRLIAPSSGRAAGERACAEACAGLRTAHGGLRRRARAHALTTCLFCPPASRTPIISCLLPLLAFASRATPAACLPAHCNAHFCWNMPAPLHSNAISSLTMSAQYA